MLLALASLSSCAFSSRGHAAPPDDVARRFAPVVLQRSHGRADYITRFDYDGNWNGADNWDNLGRFPLKAFVYSSAIETRSHWYLTYSFFHPRDWWPVSLPHVNHENDLEGALVVVEKGAPGADGQPALRAILMETIAHRKMLKWTTDAELSQEDVDGPLRVEGERPVVDIKPWKHPATAYTGSQVNTEKGVIYRYKGVAEEPRGNDQRDVGYDLLAVESTLWAHRFEVGPKQAFGEARLFPQGRFGASFNGDNYIDDGADAPWSWGHDPDHGLARGEWFMDPAKAMRTHFPRQKDRFSTVYLSNPFRGK